MTYAQLKAWLETLTPEQLAMNVSIHDVDNDEFHPLADVGIITDGDVLDMNHPILAINQMEWNRTYQWAL